jgi:phosphate transport system protein
MAVTPPQQALSGDYELEMQTLRQRLVAMSDRCREQLHRAIDAFWTGSNDKVGSIEMADRAIDGDETSIDALVLRTLATRQPVARDLRMLTAAFRLVTDLERVGDEAVDLARESPSSAPDPATPAMDRLRQMMDATDKAFGLAVGAFFNGDAGAAMGVSGANNAIDVLYAKLVGDAAAYASKHPDEMSLAVSDLNAAKCLVRIADHAANIARGALFVLGRGDMPR